MSLIISGTTATGVTLVSGNTPVTITASAYLTNNTSGTSAIYAGSALGQFVTIFNAGQIAGKSYGVQVPGLTALTNKRTGTIVGGNYGVWINSKAGTVTNAGLIAGNSGSGIYLNAAGIAFGHLGSCQSVHRHDRRLGPGDCPHAIQHRLRDRHERGRRHGRGGRRSVSEEWRPGHKPGRR